MTTETTDREKLRQLVDELPDGELPAAQRYLEYLRDRGDPFLSWLLQAPYDDEPDTDEERVSVREAYEDLKAGRLHSLAEVKRNLGLRAESWS